MGKQDRIEAHLSISSPPILCLYFPNEALAEAYYDTIKHRKEKVLIDSNRVSLDLSTSLLSVEASESMDGFIFHFESKLIAAE